MIIPLLESREVVHKLREHTSSRMLTESIDEAGHIFDRQYEVAEFIAGVVIEAIRLNKSLVSINMERFGLHFKRVEVNITKDYAWPGVKAQYLRTDEDGTVYLNILVYKHINLMEYSEKQLSGIVKSAIAHELLHSKMGFHRIESGAEKQFPLPDYYGEVTKALQQTANMDSHTYYIIYALYMVNDTEIPAFVSQVYGEVYDVLLSLKDKDSVGKAFRGALYRSHTYENFLTLRDALDNVLSLNGVEKKEILVKLLKYVPSISIKDVSGFDRLINTLKNRVVEGIHTCEECAAKAFYDIQGK